MIIYRRYYCTYINMSFSRVSSYLIYLISFAFLSYRVQPRPVTSESFDNEAEASSMNLNSHVETIELSINPAVFLCFQQST